MKTYNTGLERTFCYELKKLIRNVYRIDPKNNDKLEEIANNYGTCIDSLIGEYKYSRKVEGKAFIDLEEEAEEKEREYEAKHNRKSEIEEDDFYYGVD